MLTITIKGREEYNPATNKFITVKDTVLSLEHSLVSISKWESKFHKPFVTKDNKTNEELIYYVKCMTITQNVDPNVYSLLTRENIEEINNYITDSMTATWFNERKDQPQRRNTEQITSELVYYWMVAFNIPWEAQKWHFNRLLTLIRICNIKNQPQKKHSMKETMSRNAALNAARRKNLGTSG